MFEITGSDISNLSDGNLRTLVARLALSELRAQGCPLSSVTAGGNQDAADGGLDVRVECLGPLTKPDFVPRKLTGFQVKKPDMPASAIRDEMRPKGTLRAVISELAAASGSYIIVSAQGSVADKPLADRRNAIRKQLGKHRDARKLHTDFYDRDRLATWVNEYPGIVAWVRMQIGLRSAGWSSIGNWIGTTVVEPNKFLSDDNACLTDEGSREPIQLTIAEGIAKLRETLKTPGRCIRLVGLSGLGKTRLVQALFESQVGIESLDPSLAVYTDYSVETDPTARDMARELITRGNRAILVVDNCNPATHSELAHICAHSESCVSLLTIEYDVSDDEPEQTEVFRLRSASTDLVAQWLKQTFPNVSQVDRGRISEFSDGNFRVARAISDTLRKGETLGKLKNRDLFKRIFQQRNEHDQDLLLAVEDLSLLYSIDGEDSSNESELAKISRIRTVNTNVMYAALIRLGQRGIAQSRGRWRAILPHAISNFLAASALARIPPAEFDYFFENLTPRMQKSLSRRLGFLHDSPEASSVVSRWLSADSTLINLFSIEAEGLQIITNLAPVAPDVVLAKIELDLSGDNAELMLAPTFSNRWQLIRLIKMLAYDTQLFERSAILLSRFVSTELESNRGNSNSARDTFAELFHLYLSGTQAPPTKRCEVIGKLATSIDSGQRHCASIALDAMLMTGSFTSSNSFEFGARPRDWGWSPKFNRDVSDWYNSALSLSADLSETIDDLPKIIARRIRALWAIQQCHELLESIAQSLVRKKPWIEGWLAFRATLRYQGNTMRPNIKEKLHTIIDQLKPLDLLHQARAIVLSGDGSGWDIVDGDPDDDDVMRPWERASKMAQEVGRFLAQDDKTRKEFVSELITSQNQQRVFECGQGLAEGAADLLAMWQELVDTFALSTLEKRDPTVLGGFVNFAYQRDATFTSQILDSTINNPDLRSYLPFLQARIGIDSAGIKRLRHAISKGVMNSTEFNQIANGSVIESPPKDLGGLLLDVANLADGVAVALDILSMHFFNDAKIEKPWDQSIIKIGRSLLTRMNFQKNKPRHDYQMKTVVRVCCSGDEGEETAREMCFNLHNAIASYQTSPHEVRHLIEGLFETQTLIALDIFLLHGATTNNSHFIELHFDFDSPIEKIESTALHKWASIDPILRYELLGQSIPMFKHKNGEDSDDIDTLFLELLEYAPNKTAFLGDHYTRLQARSGVGPLVDILERRRSKILKLMDHHNTDVTDWINDILPDLELWIEKERQRNKSNEQSFE
ncbi:hypothetical protein GIV47_14905 [Pseudomonas marginalis]|nr:hypothetical protein [Pseudomonas marginalis]